MPKRKSGNNESAGAKPKTIRSSAKEKGNPNLHVFYDAEWSGTGGENSKRLPAVFQLCGPGVKNSKKVAAFDLDYTLIRPKSGRKWPTGPSDWMFLSEFVKDKLTELDSDGYKLVIITNQRGMEKGYTKPTDFQLKINQIANTLRLPIQCFAASAENHYRKPGTLMWDLMSEKENGGIRPDLAQCYYVGDAAGRAKGWAPGKPRDFSCSDRMFAANIGVQFYTPEEFFDGARPAPFEWHSLDPRKVVAEGQADEQVPWEYHSKQGAKDMIIMVGPPASGKSTFARRHLVSRGYTWINRDTLNTPAKCVKATREALSAGDNVVVDNTNPSKAARAEYISLAKEAGYQVKCITMAIPLELAFHLNMFRQSQTEGAVRRIPDVAYNVYKKNYEAPAKSEGFGQIVEVPFKANFESDKDRKLFLQWTDMK